MWGCGSTATRSPAIRPRRRARRRGRAPGLARASPAWWPPPGTRQADGGHDWPDFEPRLADEVRESFPELPLAAVALSLHAWGRTHGVGSLEIYGAWAP
ncbi:hypothetical protein [Saccharopolyspora sp. ASAGF58]|uniref:hypothetical protein n=1 Tax=Saccharopolyspora sp. ASAGF58 TaxID=2719023 RepID=UPI001FF08DC0|nr:hypothetical protein [Saccharopolyspora sp. ASAGF58]